MNSSPGLRCANCMMAFTSSMAYQSYMTHAKKCYPRVVGRYPEPEIIQHSTDHVSNILHAPTNSAYHHGIAEGDMDGGIADSVTEDGGGSDGEEVEDIQEAVDERVWSTIMNLCKGSGLSDGDVESVLDMIGSLYESGCETSLRTLTQWKRYTNDKVNRASTLIIGPNLNSSIITVSKDDVPALGEAIVKAEFYHEDMNKFLRTEFANVKYQGQFVMHAQILVDINGSR